MGDTFERIAESKEIYAFKGKLEVVADYAFLLNDDSNAAGQRKIFLYVVKPIGEEDSDLNTWQGTIHRLQQLTKRQINTAETRIVKKVSAINEKLEETIIRAKEDNNKLNETITSLKEDNKKLDQKLDEMMASMKNLVKMTSESQNRA